MIAFLMLGLVSPVLSQQIGWEERLPTDLICKVKQSNKCIAVRKVATPLRELTCHMGSHGVTCHPAEVTFPPLPQPKLVVD